MDYVKLDAAQAGPIDPASPEKTLASYFDDRKTSSRARICKISFVAITAGRYRKWSEVSDEDAKRPSRQRRDKLGTPELAPGLANRVSEYGRSHAARSRIASGSSFEDLAKERGLNPSDVDLGLITKSAIIDTAIANAAFSLPSERLSQPVQGRFGWRGQDRQDRAPGSNHRMKAFASNLRRNSPERARTKGCGVRDKMEDERGGGASVIEAGAETAAHRRDH